MKPSHFNGAYIHLFLKALLQNSTKIYTLNKMQQLILFSMSIVTIYLLKIIFLRNGIIEAQDTIFGGKQKFSMNPDDETGRNEQGRGRKRYITERGLPL